jgi:hypothetical protein
MVLDGASLLVSVTALGHNFNDLVSYELLLGACFEENFP